MNRKNTMRRYNEKNKKSRTWVWAVSTVLLGSFLTIGLLKGAFFSQGTSETPQERFFRAAYIMQSLDLAYGESLDIPSRIRYADATESLLHHPDRLFVLRGLVADLEYVRREYGELVPKAALFESYARIGLGEYKEARRLLAPYVVENPYSAKLYGLLCATLLELNDYAYLLLICKEWQERDANCHPERSRYVWLANCHLGLFEEASRSVLTFSECLGWESYVYSARALYAKGDEAEALQLLDVAREKAFDAGVEILWQQLLLYEFSKET